MNTENTKSTALDRTLKTVKAQSAASRKTMGGAVTDVAADWLASHYIAMAQEKLTEASGEERWEALRMMVRDCSLLRRGDHRSGRLDLAREKFEWLQANCKLEKEKQFREWLKRPEIQEEIYPKREGGLSPETIKEIEEALNLM